MSPFKQAINLGMLMDTFGTGLSTGEQGSPFMGDHQAVLFPSLFNGQVLAVLISHLTLVKLVPHSYFGIHSLQLQLAKCQSPDNGFHPA